MSKILFKALIIGALLIASNLSFAEQPVLLTNSELKQVSSVREQALKSNLGYEILESLTTEVGPRMAGTPQDTMAVKWAVKKFKALGFDKVWTEPVTYATWKRGVETAQVVAPFPQPLLITALGGSVSTEKGGLTAKVVHFLNLEELMAVEPSQVKGKIVFVSNRMERSINGMGYGKAVALRGNGAIEAAKKGALAIIIRSVGTDTHRVPHTGLMKYQDDIKKIPAAALSNPDADQLVRIFQRNKGVSIKLNIGAKPAGEFTSHNVIGEITGSSNPDEYIIMGGHLDSWDLGTGAVDDGAGVALTMAAATLIKNSGIKHQRTIRVVLWANEEQGLKGAKAYAEAHEKDIEQHIIGAESDFGADRIYQFSTLVTEKDMPFMQQMEKMLSPLGIKRGDNKAGPGPDLIPLYNKGMSVFRLLQNGTDYFDLHHTADDTLDKVNPKALAQNVAAYTVYALMAAQYQSDLARPKEETNNEH
jgi:carboxypeptidase Q